MVVGVNQAAVKVAQRSRRKPGTLAVPRRLLLVLPAALAAGYLIVLLVDFSAVISGINTYGDAVIAPVLAKLAGQAPPGSHVLLGHHAYYEEYLFLRATAGLPFYRGLWEVAPMVWTLLGFGLLGWAAWQTLGRFAALMTVSAAACLGGLSRFAFFSLDFHGLTVLHTIAIAAALVWLAPRAETIPWARLTLAAGGLGLISALPMASDPLFVEWALVPMGAAVGMMILRSSGRARWTLAAFGLGTALVALIAGTVIVHVMQADGVGTSAFTYPFMASAAAMLANLRFLFADLTALGGGFFFGMSADLTGLLTLLSGVLILGALCAGLREGVLLTARRRDRNVALGTTAYVGFWVSSLILQSVVFVVSGVPKENLTSARYLLAGFVAIIALVPLLARRGPRWRLAVAGGVSAFAISGVVQLAQRPFVLYGRYATAPVAQRLLAFARAQNVQYGYARYWQAPDLTWLTDFRLRIYPIGMNCGDAGLCPWAGARMDGWYRPLPGRSMLIADQTPAVAAAIIDLVGRPLVTRQFGPLTAAVYPGDIASELSSLEPAPSVGLLPLDRAGGL